MNFLVRAGLLALSVLILLTGATAAADKIALTCAGRIWNKAIGKIQLFSAPSGGDLVVLQLLSSHLGWGSRPNVDSIQGGTRTPT